MPELSPLQRPTYVLIVCLTTFSTLAVILRLYSRAAVVKKFGLDDWLIGAAMIGNIATSFLEIANLQAGTGRTMGKIDKDHWGHVLQIAYSMNIIAMFTISCVQLSYLAFYTRFVVDRVYQRAIYVLSCFVVLYSISFMLILALRCEPVSTAWNPYKYPNGCLDFPKLQACQAIISIIAESAILLLPIPMFMMLRVENVRKFALIVMFSLGLSVVAASIYRVNTLRNFKATDPLATKKTLFIINMMAIEYNIGITAACLPALKPLFMKCFKVPKTRPTFRMALNTLHFGQTGNGNSTSLGRAAQADSAVAITGPDSHPGP